MRAHLVDAPRKIAVHAYDLNDRRIALALQDKPHVRAAKLPMSPTIIPNMIERQEFDHILSATPARGKLATVVPQRIQSQPLVPFPFGFFVTCKRLRVSGPLCPGTACLFLYSLWILAPPLFRTR